ncbi:methyl-accepting chemotaxis sensory transducer [Methanolacinia petrolearia DSM 11571]|uniref:Methyl-accepting chemotaxis sensory transducer n=2 Tax=Methanolacinia TaxID=230355 RepID=E1RFV2_METP4|nr:methyl-accepting chemotaxis sensory transducer [Methanolacinia petrolearia DSM 11571]
MEMSLDTINNILKKALDGDVLARVNESEVSDEFKNLAATVNRVVEKLGDAAEAKKLQKRAEAFLQLNPQGIAVLAGDKHRLDLNKEYERIWRGGYDELMAKKLYDFNIEITGGDDFYASFETKKPAISDMEISWENGEKTYLRLFQTPILDEKGEIDVNYYIYQDLTPQREEMAEIQKLQKRAEAFLQLNPQGITVLAADKHRLDLNKEYERIWRGGYDELMAKKLYDFNINITGGDDFYASFETKKPAISDMEISWENGEKTYLRLFQTPIIDEKGEIDVNYYIYQDLTDQVEKLNEIKTLEEQSNAIVSENPMPILLWNTDLTIRKYNKAFLKLSGFSDAAAENLKLSDFKYLKQSGKSIRDTIEEKKANHGEAEMEFPSGIKVLERYNIPLLDESGRVDAVMTVYNDITILKQEMAETAKLQRRAEAFLQENPQAITVLAPDKHRLDLNKEYQRVWRGGYDELMAKKLYDFNINITGGDDFYGSFESRRRAVTEMEISWENGEKSYLRLFQTPILDEKGEIDVNYYIYQDMTPEVTISNYMNGEVDRISENLEKLSKGNLDMNLDAGAANEYTSETRRMFNRVDKSLGEAKEAVESLVEDSKMLAQAAINGRLNVRSDASKHEGKFKHIVEELNKTIDSIAAPIHEAIRVIGEYAENNYTEFFDDKVVVKGEFAEFKESINLLGQNTSNVISDVINAVDHVFVGTNEASKGSDEVAKAAEHVAMTSQKCADISREMLDKMTAIQQQIADLSASNEEVAATSQDVLKNSEEVTKMGNDAQVLGNDANRKMASVVEITNRSAEEIKELNDQIKEINKIVKMITDITSQINLLALNAAIEAARAGEHGRGFAVVAGEVKNLAADARKATEHIDKVIGEIQNNSIRTADAIQTASTEVVSGVESVDAAIKALNTIVEGSEKVTMDMSEIAKAIEDQANIANIVVSATDEGSLLSKDNLREVEELAALAEEASASTEEIGSAIHEVNKMSQKLQGDMKAFKI